MNDTPLKLVHVVAKSATTVQKVKMKQAKQIFACLQDKGYVRSEQVCK